MAEFNSYSFPPILGTAPSTLILGSMPGIASLKAQQYYAHPRNAFWPIMAELCGFDIELPYSVRCKQLTAHGIAVWDVLAACYRPGSLDQHIDEKTAELNDFVPFFETYTSIKQVGFNGQKAAALFKKRVSKYHTFSDIEFVTLPSTSPAHASQSYEQKLQVWRGLLLDLSCLIN